LGQGSETDAWTPVESVRRAGLCPDDQQPEVETLGGGISCIIALVKTRQGAWVVKQALPQLRVRDLWLADRKRILAEVACLRLIHDKIGGHPAPAVIFEDRENFACVLEYAGDGSRNWKQDLLAGAVDPNVTRRVAEILAEIHSKTLNNKDVKKRFADDTNFHQLRLDPYLATAAIHHPEIKQHLDEVQSFLADEKYCLVHGDFSPKNILLLSDGRVWVIDCEVAHYGNPVFDIAFCANHLILKAIHLKSPAHLEGARSLWSTYWSGVTTTHLEGEAVRTLATLMLARIDGKSPVEYLSEKERQRVRDISCTLVKKREESFAAIVSMVGNQVGTGRGP